jgi:hypothetical protein
LKLRLPWKLDELRQKLILTPEEKRVIAFVVAAFVLGLGTKYYRDTHAQAPPYIDPKHPWRKNVTPPPSPMPKQSPRKSRKKPNPPVSNPTNPMSILGPSTRREKKALRLIIPKKLLDLFR